MLAPAEAARKKHGPHRVPRAPAEGGQGVIAAVEDSAREDHGQVAQGGLPQCGGHPQGPHGGAGKGQAQGGDRRGGGQPEDGGGLHAAPLSHLVARPGALAEQDAGAAGQADEEGEQQIDRGMTAPTAAVASCPRKRPIIQMSVR